ncbi:MAG: hypothetical protein O7C98_10360 [Planctomycetota bacterium]|nr:hypothetical protein [Planctomycetota bacterium]
MPIQASAPCRVDLAGGTLDIWPLCHLLEAPAVTVNLALSLRAHAYVVARYDGKVEIVSEDQGQRIVLDAADLRHDRLPLATRLVEWLGPGEGLSLTLRSEVPQGSGLGGSSALAIACAGALAALHRRAWTPEQLRTGVQNVETSVLQTPTGYQDYVPALHGGVNVITATPARIEVEPVPGGHELFRGRLLLVDTGVPHHSGLTNWEVVRRFIDRDAQVRDALEQIAGAAAQMRDAVRAGDMAGVAQALDREWKERRRLAPEVSTPQIERIEAAARAAGATGAKICGAGGGGCLAILIEPDRRAAVEQAVVTAGGQLQPFEPDADGLLVEEGGDRPAA